MTTIYDSPIQHGSTAAVRRFQLPDQSDSIKASADGLEKALVKLEERLTPVLRCAEPEPTNPLGEMPEPSLVPAAEHLRGIGRHLEFLIRRVISLTERIEA